MIPTSRISSRSKFIIRNDYLPAFHLRIFPNASHSVHNLDRGNVIILELLTHVFAVIVCYHPPVGAGFDFIGKSVMIKPLVQGTVRSVKTEFLCGIIWRIKKYEHVVPAGRENFGIVHVRYLDTVQDTGDQRRPAYARLRKPLLERLLTIPPPLRLTPEKVILFSTKNAAALSISPNESMPDTRYS